MLLALGLGLSGCKSVGSLSGAVAGGATGAGSGNPAVAIAVGVGVKAAVDAGMDVYTRSLSEAEQTQIAAAAGNLSPGEKANWELRHALPFNSRSGEVMVLRSVDNALTRCKEALFTLASDAKEGEPARPWFTTTVCQSRAGWKWALAEPAVGRWGALQ